MYEVVGCSACRALWIREGDAETAQCPRCGKTHPVDRLRTLVGCETADAARDARSQLLANRSPQATDAVSDFSTLEDDVQDAGVTDAEYLTAHGIDPVSVETDDAPNRRDRRETVLFAIGAADPPTRERVLDISERHGVSRDETMSCLHAMIESGDVLREAGEYRVL